MIRKGLRMAAVATGGLAALAGVEHAAAAVTSSMAFDTEGLQTVGWRGFLDAQFLLQSFAALLLATVLGGVIAYHPMTVRTVDTLEEAELPKVYILYSVVGAMVGVTVLQYGLVVGFVVFGLGGLMRFRTTTENARDTGRLIIVTLLGLISGLNLPHFAVLAAAFAFVLIYLFDGFPICRLVVRELPGDQLAQAAEAYRAALVKAGCRIVSQRKGLQKRRVEFVFRAPRKATQESLQTALAGQIPDAVRGEADWEVE